MSAGTVVAGLFGPEDDEGDNKAFLKDAPLKPAVFALGTASTPACESLFTKAGLRTASWRRAFLRTRHTFPRWGGLAATKPGLACRSKYYLWPPACHCPPSVLAGSAQASTSSARCLIPDKVANELHCVASSLSSSRDSCSGSVASGSVASMAL